MIKAWPKVRREISWVDYSYDRSVGKAGKYCQIVWCYRGALHTAAEKELTHLDEKLYFQCFGTPPATKQSAWTGADMMTKRPLSPEAAEELVRYLYLLIDQIQFSYYGEQLKTESDEHSELEKDDSSPDFDDPIPFWFSQNHNGKDAVLRNL